MVSKSKYKYTYDPEADVLAMYLVNRPFDYAEEMGDFIVHFDKEGRPVYLELLNASQHMAKTATSIPKKAKAKLFGQI